MQFASNAAKLRPVPEHVTDRKFSLYQRQWGTVTKYERFYIPPQAIKTMRRRAADGYQGSSQYHATASNGDGNIHVHRDWGTCECCWSDPIMMSRACNRQPGVGGRKRHRLQLQSGAQLSAQARGRRVFFLLSARFGAVCELTFVHSGFGTHCRPLLQPKYCHRNEIGGNKYPRASRERRPGDSQLLACPYCKSTVAACAYPYNSSMFANGGTWLVGVQPGSSTEKHQRAAIVCTTVARKTSSPLRCKA